MGPLGSKDINKINNPDRSPPLSPLNTFRAAARSTLPLPPPPEVNQACRVCFVLLEKGNEKNNVNTLTIAAETGYNQVIQRGKKIQPSIYAKFAFTSVNCTGVVVVEGLVRH